MSSCLIASATVGPCLTTLVSMYGGEDEKGTIIGIFRSLGALSRAVGPVIASTGENQYSVLSVAHVLCFHCGVYDKCHISLNVTGK